MHFEGNAPRDGRPQSARARQAIPHGLLELGTARALADETEKKETDKESGEVVRRARARRRESGEMERGATLRRRHVGGSALHRVSGSEGAGIEVDV